MAKLIQTDGTLTVQTDRNLGGNGACTKDLALGASGCSSSQRYADAVACTSQQVSTTGDPGDAFDDLDGVDDLSEIEFLFLRSDNDVVLRLDAVPADAQAVAGAFPTGFGGGETLITTIDGVAVTTTFDAADQSAAQCAARINAAMALAGIATPRADVVAGQIHITGVATAVAGAEGLLSFAGTGAAQLGLDAGSSPTITPAKGQDVTISGLFLAEFSGTSSRKPTAAQISGNATVEIIAAGRS